MDTRNIEVELLECIGEIQVPIKCARIKYGFNFQGTYGDDYKEIDLKCNYSADELRYFLADINFEYSTICDDIQNSIVWFNDGTWMDRYSDEDGSCYWVHRHCPKIPKQLLTK